MTSMILRAGSSKDASAIADLIASFQFELTDHPEGIGADQFLASVSLASERGYLESNRYRYIVADRAGEMLGFIALRDETHIFHLFVSREKHRAGIARLLWETAKAHVFETSSPSHFTVNSSLRAVPVYRAFGFDQSGTQVSVHGVSIVPMSLTVLTREPSRHPS